MTKDEFPYDARPTTYDEIQKLSSAWNKYLDPPTSSCKAAASALSCSISPESLKNSRGVFRSRRGSASNARSNTRKPFCW